MEKAMAPHSSTLAWKIPWMEDLACCSPWGHKELDMTDRLNNNIMVKRNDYVYVFLYIKYYGIVSLVWKPHEDGQFTYFVHF